MAPTTPGWAHPYRNPFVWYADGGDDTSAAEDSAPTVETEADQTADEEWTPPSREEYEQLIAAKRKADGEAAARRKYLKAHGIDPKTGEKTQPETPDEPVPQAGARAGEEPRGVSEAEVKRAVDRAAADAEIRGLRKTKTLVTSLNAGLSEAGWNGQRLGLLMKLIDLDEVEVDSDGEVIGLAEQIERAKADLPEAFKRQRSTVSNGTGVSGQNGVTAAKVEAADKKPPAAEPQSWADRLAARALRG